MLNLLNFYKSYSLEPTSTKLAYQSHEFNDFWKEIRKQNKALSALSNCVAGVTGETAIADMWRDHYEELLNSSANSLKEHLLEHFKSISSHVGMQVTMLEVLQIVKDLPNAKSSGLDGLNGESLKYAHPYCVYFYLLVSLVCLNIATFHNV